MLGQSKLAFRAPFGLHGNMPPAEHSLTSLSATDESIHGPAVFATTHWSVVLEAQSESAAAQKLLKLCRTYRRPIYGYVRRHGAGTQDAEDLTQSFFALLVERKDLNSVRKEKGRLRSYLLASVKHFFAGESPHAMALKRGKGQRLIPFDDIRGGGAHRSGTLRSAHGRPNPRTALGLYGIGASDGTIA